MESPQTEGACLEVAVETPQTVRAAVELAQAASVVVQTHVRPSPLCEQTVDSCLEEVEGEQALGQVLAAALALTR